MGVVGHKNYKVVSVPALFVTWFSLNLTAVKRFLDHKQEENRGMSKGQLTQIPSGHADRCGFESGLSSSGKKRPHSSKTA